jgi:hypothetical protein
MAQVTIIGDGTDIPVGDSQDPLSDGHVTAHDMIAEYIVDLEAKASVPVLAFPLIDTSQTTQFVTEYSTSVKGDVYPRFQITVDGTQSWGPGTTTFDTTFSRTNAGALTLKRVSGAAGLYVDASTNASVNWFRSGTQKYALYTYSATDKLALFDGSTLNDDIMSWYQGVIAWKAPVQALNTQPAQVAFRLQLAASQTADALEILNSGGTKISWIDPTGWYWQPADTGLTIGHLQFGDSTTYGWGSIATTDNRRIVVTNISALQIYAPASVFNNNAAANALLVQGAASQGGNLLALQTNASVNVFTVGPTGAMTASSAILTAPASTIVPLRINGAASQTANLQEWWNSTPQLMLKVTPAGDLAYHTLNNLSFVGPSGQNLLKLADWSLSGGAWTDNQHAVTMQTGLAASGYAWIIGTGGTNLARLGINANVVHITTTQYPSAAPPIAGNMLQVDGNVQARGLTVGQQAVADSRITMNSPGYNGDNFFTMNRGGANNEWMRIVAAAGGSSGLNNTYVIDRVGTSAPVLRDLAFRISTNGGSSYNTVLDLTPNGGVVLTDPTAGDVPFTISLTTAGALQNVIHITDQLARKWLDLWISNTAVGIDFSFAGSSSIAEIGVSNGASIMPDAVANDFVVRAATGTGIRFGINGQSASAVVIGSTGGVIMTAQAATAIPLTIKEAASQSAVPFQIQNSAGAALFSVNPLGYLILTGTPTSQVSIVPNGGGQCILDINNGTNEWWIYQNVSDGSLYFRDMKNAKMQMSFYPGASAALAVTEFVSTVQVDGYFTVGTAGSYGGGTGSMMFLGNDTADPSTNPTGGTILFSSAGVLKARTPNGAVTQIAPANPAIVAAANPYVPWNINIDYSSNIATGHNQYASGNGTLITSYPWFSGPTAITISQISTYVGTAFVAGTVIRVGVYTITNQASPFQVTWDTPYATLTSELGTMLIDSTGNKTLAVNLTIPANTWFFLAAVEQGDTGNTGKRWVGVNTAGSPSAYGSNNSPGAYWSYQATGLSTTGGSVLGVLPTTYTPHGTTATDAGISFHRSA